MKSKAEVGLRRASLVRSCAVNARSSVSIVVAMGALLSVAMVYRQHALLRALRDEAAQWQSAVATNASRETSATGSRPTAATLSDADKLELMRLRAAVAQLLQRQRELANVRTENAKLRTAVAAGKAGPVNGVAAPPGWMRRRDAQFIGTATPEASLQSLFWAIEHQDTNRLLAVHAPASVETIQRMLEQEGSKDLWEQFRMVVGYRVVGREVQSEDEIVLKVEILPGEPPTDMTVTRINHEWKLSL
jgi:hypothetical protein